MAEKADTVDPQTPQSSSTSSIPLIEKEKNVITFNHNLSVKLDDKNYLLWRQQILAALEGHDLEKYVTGSRFVPPKFDTEGDRDAGKLSLNYLKWKKQDKVILSWLLGSMTESMLTHVNECEHSYEAWNIMIEQFGINTKARVHLYRTELRGIKKGTKTMSEFLLKIKAIAGALRAIGSPISEHEHMQYILEGLPPEYESFVTSANMKTDLTSIGELEAFRTGHIASACYNRYDSNYQLSQQQYSQNFAQARQRSSGNMAAMVATPDAVNDAAWFPDSGATNHVTSDASNLMNGVEYTSAEQLHMGNGKGLLISNIGQSLVKSSFQPNLSLVLNNLLHVPSITKNLVSVSKFAKDNSVFFEFHSDACYVKSQATKATLLKGSIRPDGLYYFTDFKLLHQSSQPDCSIQSSSSASPIVLTSTIGPSLSNSVTSNCTAVTPYTLWHYRLGHCNSATVMAVLKIYISRDVKFDEISFPYKDVSSKPLVSVPSSITSLSSASPLVAVQYETSVKLVTITNTNNCGVSINEMVCDNSVSTDQATNVHPMVTRAKAGVFKPKILLAHMGKYIQDLLVKSKMDGACAISTPMVSNAKLSRDGNNVMADPSLYRSTVGALQAVRGLYEVHLEALNLQF
ncbi:Retrovirus-related Pol polyprotein from transposon TNT 1-94 [Senna tora]|uniref:Retrovirus-related Pol polyprotein from transposon TNT 1-94 n=1 Tax=Senna tora TaxID=362788 RepID=A0A834TLC1_9FABA|nr:Retrovirus-related Pol polyprotein from transposon TNT 1-94 [Senna tora]